MGRWPRRADARRSRAAGAGARGGRRVPAAPPLDGPGAETRFLASLWDALGRRGRRPSRRAWCCSTTRSARTRRRCACWPTACVDSPAGRCSSSWSGARPRPTRCGRGGSRGARRGSRRRPRTARQAVGRRDRRVDAGHVEPDVARRLWQTTKGVPRLLVEYLRADPSEDVLTAAARRWSRPASRRSLRPDVRSSRPRRCSAADSTGDVVRSAVARTRRRSAPSRSSSAEGSCENGRATTRSTTSSCGRSSPMTPALLVVACCTHGPPTCRARARVVARHLQVAGRERTRRRLSGAAEEARRCSRTRRQSPCCARRSRSGTATAPGARRPRGPPGAAGDYAEALRARDVRGRVRAAELTGVEHASAASSTAEASTRSPRPTCAPPSTQRRRATYRANRVDRGPEPRRALGRGRRASAQARGTRRAGHPEDLPATARSTTARPGRHGGRRLTGRSRTWCVVTRSRSASGDPELRVATLNNLALARRAQGDLPAAVDLTTQALDVCVALGDRHREAALLNNLADLLHAAGRGEKSMARLKAAVEIFAEVGAQEQDPLRPEVWKLFALVSRPGPCGGSTRGFVGPQPPARGTTTPGSTDGRTMARCTSWPSRRAWSRRCSNAPASRASASCGSGWAACRVSCRTRCGSASN